MVDALLSKPRWPIGASFDDRFDELCRSNDRTRQSIAEQLGLWRERHLIRNWGNALTDTDVEALSSATAATPEALRASVLQTFDGTALRFDPIEPPRVLITRSWIFLRGTRLCVACWNDDGYEHVHHRLPWTFACTRHELLLLDRCEACGRRFRAGKRNDRTGPVQHSAIPESGHCTNPPRTGHGTTGRATTPCDHPYRDHRQRTASADELHTQATLESAIRSESTPPSLGQRVTTLELLDDLRSIAALLLRAPDVAGSPDDSYDRHFLRPPESSETMGAVTTLALRIVTQPDADTAAMLLAPHVEDLLAGASSTTRALHARTRPTARTRAILDQVLSRRGRPTTRLRRIIQTQLPLGRPTSDEIDLAAAALLYDQHAVAVAMRLGRVRRDLGVLTAALDLCRLTGVKSYPAAARHLGLHPTRAPRQARYVRSRLDEAGLLDAWASALRDALKDLADVGMQDPASSPPS